METFSSLADQPLPQLDRQGEIGVHQRRPAIRRDRHNPSPLVMSGAADRTLTKMVDKGAL